MLVQDPSGAWYEDGQPDPNNAFAQPGGAAAPSAPAAAPAIPAPGSPGYDQYAAGQFATDPATKAYHDAYLAANPDATSLDAYSNYYGSPNNWQPGAQAQSSGFNPQSFASAGGGGSPTPTPTPSGGGGGGGGSAFSWPTPPNPSPYSFTPFSYQGYTPLTADQAANEPGYAFARQQGRDAIQTSAAAKGNVLSGGTLKDLFAWGDQFAGQNYQQAEARNQQIYNMNRGNAFNNWAGNNMYGLQAWQANNQPQQFAAGQNQQQAALTFADLFNRWNTGVNANTQIATAGLNG